MTVVATGQVQGVRVPIHENPVNHWAFCDECPAIIKPKGRYVVEDKGGKKVALCPTCRPVLDLKMRNADA